MSHFTTLATRIASKEHLLKALDQLGVQYEEGDLEIRGYEGIRANVEIRIPTSDPDYQLGFRRKGDLYELVADWYGVKDVKKEEFLGRITQRYAYLVALDLLAEQDFSVVEENVRNDNTIHLTLRRMV